MVSLKIVQITGDNSQISPSFDALSYTWGSSSITYPLVVDGKEIQIHQNLYQALPYLSRRPSTLPLWIDAVSINQADEAEKFIQIRLMTDIYRSANTVWVWLGLPRVEVKPELLKDILIRMDEISSALIALGDENVVSPSEVNLPDLDAPVWEALDNIINNPWFLRLWIIQEAALAKRISCLFGSHVIEWKDLEQTVSSAPQLRHLQDKNGRKLGIVEGPLISNIAVFYCRNIYQDWVKDREHKPYSLQELVMGICYQVLNHKCSNPRDRVFGLLGFVDSEHQDDIAIDQNTSLPDLYVEFMLFVLQSTGSFKMMWWSLIKVALDDDKTEGIPSWCPDLHHAKPLWKAPWSLAIQGPYQASSTDIICRKGLLKSEIILKGTEVDEIKSLGPVFEDAELKEYTGHQFCSWLLEVMEWESLTHKFIFENNFGSPGFKEEEYWLTLIGNRPDWNQSQTLTFDDYVSFKSLFNELHSMIQKLGRDRILEQYEDKAIKDTLGPFENNKAVRSTLIAIKEIQNGRRLFKTVSNRLGFADKSIRSGDGVCIFEGASIAHIIRDARSKSQHKQHQLVGEAYLHGAMNGEVAEWSLESRDITLI